jgi:hypothetical protein
VMKWRKSSFSNGGGSACVEFAPTDDGVAMRDSKLGDASPILYFSEAQMAAFLAGAKNGEFDDLAG